MSSRYKIEANGKMLHLVISSTVVCTHMNAHMLSSWAGRGNSTGGDRSTSTIYTAKAHTQKTQKPWAFTSHKVSGLNLSGLEKNNSHKSLFLDSYTPPNQNLTKIIKHVF